MPDPQRSVAVIDDDPGMRRGIERLLNVHGFATESYASAEEFMARNGQGTATCIVLDIGLEGISGIELRRRMMASGCAIPTIFITGRDDPATLGEAEELGCVACLLKPFPASTFIRAINEALASSFRSKGKGEIRC
jgi:FixJ family two-component response regulator